MPYILHYDQNIPCLISHFAGNFDREIMKKHANELVQIALKCKCKSFLENIKKTIWNLSIFTLYNILEILHGAGIDQSWTGAIVVSPTNFDHYKFIETIAINRGYIIKVFKDQKKATSWLKKHK